MAGKLDGKTAIVTGASSGIGEAAAFALAQEGAYVALAARRADRLATLEKRIAEAGGRAVSIVTDLANEKQVQDMVVQAQQKLGRVDILVNNAGIAVVGPIDGADLGEWKRMMDVNVWGLMVATHAALPLMKAAGGGHIVFVSSSAGRTVSPLQAVYAATKFAVGAFAEGLRRQESKNKIRMTLIEPGAVATELVDHITHQGSKDMLAAWIGGMTPLQSEDIAAAIVYAVTQPPHVNVNEILIRPTEQDS